VARFFLVLLFVVNYTVGFSQEADSLVYNPDSTYAEIDAEDQPDSTAPPDSSDVAARSFDSETLKDLKADPSLQYKEVPTVAESLWDHFKLWISQLIQAIFENAVNTNWGRVFAYIVGIVVVAVLIMMLLKVNALKVFYSAQGAGTFKHTVLDENIHEMDFDKLIQEAMANHDYRMGIRLVFLYSLKMLSDKNLIHWDQGKTNHDYIKELKAADLKTGFNELNYYFEYAWYGNFKINREIFSKVQVIFDDWKNRLRTNQ
jgi:hypothetical protein